MRCGGERPAAADAFPPRTGTDVLALPPDGPAGLAAAARRIGVGVSAEDDWDSLFFRILLYLLERPLTWVDPLHSLEALGWQWAMGLPALGPLVAWVLMRLAAPNSSWPQRLPKPNTEASPSRLHWQMLFPVSAWRRACQSRAVVGYAFGYGVHCMALFGSRAWTVAFIVFAMAQPSSGHWPFTAAAIAAFVNLLSVPSSIVGNEIALRLGRQPWIRGVMVATTLFSLVLSLSAGLGFAWWMTVVCLGLYSMMIMADSATLTAGFVQAAAEEVKGAAMGLYSLIGFGAGAVGPAVFGAVLDLAGGETQPPAWALAYLAIGIGCLVYPFVQRRLFTAQPAPG